MPTEIYKINYVYTMDGEEIEIIPLKIKFLRQLMDSFSFVRFSENEEETINILSECIRITMKQYSPALSKTIEDVQDNFDLKTIYQILDYSAGIKMSTDSNDQVENIPEETERASNWDDLDLAELETEAFVLGIWKNFDELESSISMEELMKIVSANRELNYEEKKFMAALKGIDLDEKSGRSSEAKGQKEWEDMKARVFSRGSATDANDVLALQGQNAKKAGFGIGMGLGYTDLRDPSVMITKPKD